MSIKIDDKKKDGERPVGVPFPGPGETQGRISWFQALFASASGLLRLVLLPAATRAQIRMLWGDWVPRLALALANMIDAAPDLFGWVPWSAARLRETATLIDELTEIQAAQEDFATRLNDTLLFHRSELFRAVSTTSRGLTMTLDNPATDPAHRARLAQLSSAVRAILDERSAQLKGARQEGAAIAETEERVSELEAKVAEKDAELRTLGGEVRAPATAPAPVALKAARRPRRTRR